MFSSRRRKTIIAEGLKIAGTVSAEGLVELHGEIEGELHCTALRISKKGVINGKIMANDVVVNGTVEGPIDGKHVSLQSDARVTGDVHHQSFAIEKGAFFAGKSIQREERRQEKIPKLTAKKDPKAKDPKIKGHNGASKENAKSKGAQEGAAPLA